MQTNFHYIGLRESLQESIGFTINCMAWNSGFPLNQNSKIGEMIIACIAAQWSDLSGHWWELMTSIEMVKVINADSTLTIYSMIKFPKLRTKKKQFVFHG
jgi:hypothetical protein